jgi:transcriptional regulator with XRE-family HTH domain
MAQTMAPTKRKGAKASRAPSANGRESRLLGQKLKILMGYHGIANYRELSRRVGVGFETLRLLHTGEGANPNIKNLYPLARSYDVPIEVLVNDEVRTEDVLQWVGTRFAMDQPEQRLRCPNLRALIKSIGYGQVTEKITAQYFQPDGTLVTLTTGRGGEIVYQGPERRRPPETRRSGS